MRPDQNWHKWLVLLGLALSVRPIVSDYSGITDKFGTEAVELCNEKCPFQNRTGDSNFDLSCGPDCSIQQCALGCSLWKQGLEQTCQTTCNVTSETVVSRELYCVMGCNEALNTYLQKLRDLIGIPPSPALVADSLTATALSLLWEAPHLANLSYLAQWRYEELTDSWQYCTNHSRPERSIVHVDNLRPYTKYRFRIAIFLSARGGTVEPIYSAQSVVISTLENGKPSSAPASLRAVALDDSRVSISWKPGPFPNGPLISYVLRLADTRPNSYTALEDMPASNNTLFYMFQNLSPEREYEVSVAMRNAVGEGPRAMLRVSTPASPTVMPSQQPKLILGGEQSIFAAQANDMLSDPMELYTTEFNISGVGIDVSRDYLFVSTSNGYVYKSSLSKKSKSVPILTPDSISYKPLDLSVDWLNKHLYILGEVYYTKEGTHWPNTTKYSNWEIQRCDFDGKNQLVALAGFNSRPIHFEVDPYNGYIFWALRGVERGGLYRLDLANISNGVHHDAPPEMILRDAHLGAFTVDHTDFRLLVANRRQNRTVLAVSLDGREVNDLRRNTQTPMFQLVRSMAFAGGLFYWTNGKEMLTEEYHKETDSYYHNEFHVVFNTKRVATRQVLVALRSCQPIPVPVNPPIGVQSVMGMDKAKVSWSVPHLLGHQGSGAWQQWGFHLQLTDASTGDIIERNSINGTTFMVENLRENSEYIVKVAAATESGSGPWSSEFIGSTLPSTEATLQSTLLWSGPDGLLQTDLTGGNMKTLIHSSHLKNVLITDISWYRDKLYLLTNISSVLWYNTTSHEKGLMANMDHVGSLAVDWVGKRIYWSNPKQQLITRGNLDGGNREPVPIVTVAKELVIDSLSAYIYWNTGHAVEAARLNGENKMVYYPAQLFSGKQVMGITADLDNKRLYWIVRSYDGSELHRAPTADAITTEYDVSQSVVTRLSGASSMSSLRYFSGRLAWVRDSTRAVLSDATGRYCAELQPRVRAIAVREPTLHGRSVDLVAIPEAINKSSILVTGVWDKFNVSWSPAEHVNHGRVFYDVSLHFHGYYKIEKTLEHPWVLVRERSVPPYSAVEVSVRAHTAWGAGTASSVALRTPQAAPASPRAPRVYLLHKHDGETDAIFRWDPPVRSNGVILSFESKCWTTPHEGSLVGPISCGMSHLPRDYHQQRLANLLPNTTYHFKVRAYTEAGFGFYSDTVSCSSNDINPVPKILMSTQEFIKIMDLDNGEIITVPKIIGMPVDFGVAIEEKEIYWSNNLEEIFASHFFGNGHYKLSTTNGSSSSIAVDWVGRAVYWAQHEPTASQSHAVYRAVLGLPQSRSRSSWVLSSRRPVYNLQISPLTRTLYWYEAGEHAGLGTLMMSNTDGSNITPFFNRSMDTDCDCPENPQVARPFVLDVSGEKQELFWVDPWAKQIVASDIDGCHCRTILGANHSAQLGFPPVSITMDSRNIYWYNSTDKYVYYRDKYRLAKVNQIKTVLGSKIIALDSANQPYPRQECLFPQSQKLELKIVTNSANSLTIELPEVNNSKECSSFDSSATEYTVYYQLDNSDSVDEAVMSVSTVDKEVVLSNLLTFANYTVHIEATNFYAKRYGVPPLKSSAVVLQTAAEAPSAAEDLTATVLSPVLARVEWGARPDVWYQLYWATNQSDHSQHKFQEHNTFPVSEGRAANMSHLSPNTSYVVWVRACSNYSKVYTDSQHISVHTYPLPSRIVEYKITAYSILVQWKPPTEYKLASFKVEYSDSTNHWLSCSPSIAPDVWSADALRPRTSYRFRLKLQYTRRAPPYYWPHDDRFSFVTLGDVPGPPGMPRVQAVDSRVLRAWWSEPVPHGHPVTLYRVWGRAGHRIIDISDNSTENIIDQSIQNLPDDIDDHFKSTVLKEGLVLLHNSTDNYWLISSEAASNWAGGWRVSVQARNELGWGPLSAAAELRVPPAAAPPAAAAALLAAAAALAALAAAVAAAIFYVHKNRLRKKKAALQSPQTNVIRRGPDVELATLRQLPIRHSNNILYNQGILAPSDAELAALPHISREQITLHKFLGSGAFGEVFEGVARNLHGAREDTKVAVKTLRKGASEQEKTEFLQEAALMSNFKHEHILRLLGVCLDNDPNYIIMELMEGGDLLSYLRAKRASLYSSESLTLRELLSMCVDVTQGCRYLEEMHFVHRDLAARNCLVATRNGHRIVKIGDFGLARDIYRNDYYRKAGEGLLPVRWMAVECLVDGVFSCQSDVWAWAVLCWEVLSLGQQPYPARTNRQVLAFVRAGGSPDRPPNCPSALYELLQRCWSYAAEHRPTFKHCLEVVTTLRDLTADNVLLSAVSQPPHYLTLIASELAVDNRTYLLDENDNACIEEDAPDEMEPSRLLPTPKYLQLMYDSDSGTAADGYEVPVAAPLPATLLSRRSTGEYPRRSPYRSCRRSLSLRQPRPANATIVPLRNGIAKRASLCDSLHGPFLLDSTEFQLEKDVKTPL